MDINIVVYYMMMSDFIKQWIVRKIPTDGKLKIETKVLDDLHQEEVIIIIRGIGIIITIIITEGTGTITTTPTTMTLTIKTIIITTVLE